MAVVEQGLLAVNVDKAREKVTKPFRLIGSLVMAFEIKGKGKILYSHRQHTPIEKHKIKQSFNQVKQYSMACPHTRAIILHKQPLFA